MITVKRARKEDFNAIHALLGQYGKMSITPEHLQGRDIALQARDAEGKVVGFVWAGLMANDTVAYVDKVSVAPECAKKQVSQALYKRLFEIALKRGVRQAFGIIRHDAYHDRAAMNALKMAFGADKEPYTYVSGDLMQMHADLKESA